MAKQKQTETTQESSESSVAPTDKQLKLAAKVVVACTGCGKLEAQSRVASMGATKVVKLASLEEDGKRAAAVKLLYDRG